MKKIVLLSFLTLLSLNYLCSFVYANESEGAAYRTNASDAALAAESNSPIPSNNGGGSNGGNSCENGVKLNTNIPGIGKCIPQDQAGSAFSTLMGSMMKLIVNITVAVAFIALIAAGVMMTVSGVSQSTAGKGKELLKKVVLGIVLLGLSGIILHTINPNFFKTGLTYQIIKKLKD